MTDILCQKSSHHKPPTLFHRVLIFAWIPDKIICWSYENGGKLKYLESHYWTLIPHWDEILTQLFSQLEWFDTIYLSIIKNLWRSLSPISGARGGAADLILIFHCTKSAIEFVGSNVFPDSLLKCLIHNSYTIHYTTCALKTDLLPCESISIAKLRSSWQVQYQSNWELRLVLISVWHPPTPPTHPGKYIWATSRLPRKLKFGMEALFNQTRSTS